MRTALKRFWQGLNAAQMALAGFILLIFTGAVILWLPLSTTGEPISFIDALFTSTSAVCVTGLTVVDTGTKFTLFGQIVILVLIQMGGFGIMTLSTFVLFMMGQRVTFRMMNGASGSFLNLGHYSLGAMLGSALIFTFCIEAAAALILFGRWVFDFPLGRAVWLSIFHSISGFCNAGFSLFPDSLEKYAGDPVINITVMTIIVLGGIGFFVLIDLWDSIWRRSDPRKKRISFHTKIVLLMSLLLIVSGAVIFYFIEYSHSLGGLTVGQGFLRSLFLSITARTAGFNTVDTHHLSNATLFLLIVFMTIGGAPGSMAGGIKVTTAGVILLVAVSRLRGLATPSLFGRSLAREDLERAVSLILLAVGLIVVMTILLLITELGDTDHVDSRGLFMELLFECVSAFGTVGLSTGSTPNLSEAGRLIITAVMLIGRLGPLTLVLAMERRKPPPRMKYPHEKIMIG